MNSGKKKRIMKFTGVTVLLLVGVVAFLAGNMVNSNQDLVLAAQSKLMSGKDLKQIPINTVDDLLLFILRSHENWTSVDADGILQSEDIEIYHHLILTQQSLYGPFLARLQFGFQTDKMPYTYVSNGEFILMSQSELEIYSQSPYIQQSFLFPPTILPDISDADNPIIPHPVDGMLPSPLTEILFPAAIAQSMALDIGLGNVTIQENSVVAGRPAYVIQWIQVPGAKQKFWIDTELGVILKREIYQDNGQRLIERLEITKISFNQKSLELDLSLNTVGYSALNLMEFRQVVSEEWSNYFGGGK